MKDVQGLLSSLKQKGVSLWSQGDQIHYRSLKGAMTAEDIERVKACKHEIIQFLRQAAEPQKTVSPILPADRTAGVDPLPPLPIQHPDSAAWQRRGLHGETVPILNPAERHRLLVDFNDTAADYPNDTCIHEAFSAQAQRTPDALALISGTRRLTYRELDARSSQLAHYLRSLGVQPEDRVAICAERSIELVTALLGVLKSGGAYLALDPSQPPERLALLLQDVQVKILLVQERWLEHLPAHQICQVLLNVDWPLISQHPMTGPLSELTPQALAYVTYSSGSTGKPKAVAATHAAVMNRIFAQRQIAPFTAGDVCCQKTAVTFVDSVVETLGPLLNGLPLVIISDHAGKDTQELLALIGHHRVTYLLTVPSLAYALIQSDQAARCLGSLRHWVLSGESFSTDLLRLLRRRLPSCTFINVYGSSEVGADATYYVASEEIAGPTVPIGRPIANMRVFVLGEGMALRPIGVSGELYIGGVGLAPGYLNDPHLSAERFIPSPWPELCDRLFRTGDRARWLADGNLEFIGRVDSQVKIRGYRIELSEVEAALLEHAQVLQAAVVVRGEKVDSKRLAAYVELTQGSTLTPEALKHHLRKTLPEYMVPASIDILDRLPLNSSGKIDRLALRTAKSSLVAKRSYIEPRTETERMLCSIWAQVLESAKVGVQDDFFEIGGHSLLATRILSQVRELFGVDLRLKTLIELPKIEQLAGHIDALASAGDRDNLIPVLLPQTRSDRILLSFAQHRLWLRERSGLSDGADHLAATVKVSGAIDIDVLERSLRTLSARHEILRTHFQAHDEIPFQLIDPVPPKCRPIFADLSSSPPKLRKERLRSLLFEETSKRFDLALAPLLRLLVVRLAEDEFALAVIAHKIICDSQALEILVEEISAIYASLVENSPITVPAPSIQYPDYAIWQRSWLRGERLQSQIQYARECAEKMALFHLPTDQEKLHATDFRFETVAIALPQDLCGRIVSVARSRRASPYTLLLAAFQLLLSRWSKQDHVWIAAPAIGRGQWQTRNLIGPFEKVLALQVEVSIHPNFLSLIEFSQRTLEEAATQQVLSVEDAMSALHGPGGKIWRSPLHASYIWRKVPATSAAHVLQQAPLTLIRTLTPYELSLHIQETAELSLGACFEYAYELFERSTIEMLSQAFVELLGRLLASPEEMFDPSAQDGIVLGNR